MSDWSDVSLAELTRQPRLIAKRHEEITQRHGPVAANHAAQALRAIYNHTRKIYTSLPPENPVRAVEFNSVERRDVGMSLDDLGPWFKRLRRLPNPLRREFHLFLLLSGGRPGALIAARWEHLDVANRSLFVPKPKGGSKRAFHMPLSRGMLRCLARARRAGRVLHPENTEWIFPGSAPSGHIEEWKERRSVLPKYGNDLRHTYAAIAKILAIDPLFLKLLMNHRVADVTDGYAANSSLRKELTKRQENITRAILDQT